LIFPLALFYRLANTGFISNDECPTMIDAIDIRFRNVPLTVDFSCNEVCIIAGGVDITDLVGKHERAEIIEIASAKLYELNAA
jgi:hypothetical protein